MLGETRKGCELVLPGLSVSVEKKSREDLRFDKFAVFGFAEVAKGYWPPHFTLGTKISSLRER